MPSRRSHERRFPERLRFARRAVVGPGHGQPGHVPHRRAAAPSWWAGDDSRLRVLVIDDDVAACAALTLALEDEEVTVIGRIASARDGLAAARRAKPDLLFVGLPVAEGVALIERVSALDLGIRSVALAVRCDPDDGVAAILAGARAYLSKSDLAVCSVPHLLKAVMADDLVCPRAMASAMTERLAGCRAVDDAAR